MIVFVRIVRVAIFVLSDLSDRVRAADLLELRLLAMFVDEMPVFADRVLHEQHVREAGAEGEKDAEDDEQAGETQTNAERERAE